MNPRVNAPGETVLRVRDLQAVKRFYVGVIGLDSGRWGSTSAPSTIGYRRHSMYVRDPEGNILPLVCHDESIE